MAHSVGTYAPFQTSTSNPHTSLSITVDAADTVLTVFILTGSATLRTGGAPTAGGVAMTQAGSTQQAGASPETSVELWYLLDPAAGSTTISVPNSGGLSLTVAAYTGQASSGNNSALDVAGGGTGTSTNPTASVTTTVNGDIIFSVTGSGSNAWNPSANDGDGSDRSDLGTFGISVQYKLQATSGAQSMGHTFGTSDDWAIAIAAFKEVPASVSYTKNLTETATIADSLIRGVARTVLESFSLTDTLTKIRGQIKTLVESVAATDIITRGATKNLAENGTISDVLNKGTARVFSESPVITDTLNKSGGKVLSETFSTTDFLTRIIGKIYSEAATITDTLTKSRLLSKVLSETFTVADTIVKTIAKILPESFTVTDILKKFLNGLLAIFSDKYTGRGTSYNNKYTPRNSTYSDKYNHLQ